MKCRIHGRSCARMHAFAPIQRTVNRRSAQAGDAHDLLERRFLLSHVALFFQLVIQLHLNMPHFNSGLAQNGVIYSASKNGQYHRNPYFTSVLLGPACFSVIHLTDRSDQKRNQFLKNIKFGIAFLFIVCFNVKHWFGC